MSGSYATIVASITSYSSHSSRTASTATAAAAVAANAIAAAAAAVLAAATRSFGLNLAAPGFGHKNLPFRCLTGGPIVLSLLSK